MSEAVAAAMTALAGFQWPEFIRPHIEVLLLWMTWAIKHIDFDYLEYLLYLFLPIIIIFVVPILLLLFIYGCVIFLHIYRFRNRIREELHTGYWSGARVAIASFWDGVGHIWHGYEVRGLENIPDEGPALFIYFHGCLPIDVYYLIAKCILHKNRSLTCVGDNFIFRIPGWGLLTKVFSITPGTVEDCTSTLKAGNLLSIAPGGVREALFSDPRLYDIMWGKRLGFARVIINSRTPVIPMFTENCRDAFRVPQWGRTFFRWVYEKTKIPLVPIYGGFPVKMITHLGKPITFDYDNVTPEEVRKIIKREVRTLIKQNQQLPGSIFRGIAQRFRGKKGDKTHEEMELLARAGEDVTVVGEDDDMPESIREVNSRPASRGAGDANGRAPIETAEETREVDT